MHHLAVTGHGAIHAAASSQLQPYSGEEKEPEGLKGLSGGAVG